MCSSSAAPSTPRRPAGTWSRAGRPGSGSGSTRTSSPRPEECRSPSTWTRGASTTSRQRGLRVSELAASEVAAVLLPVAALFLGRPMPPARALVDAGAIVALATDFNPGSAFCESLPVVWRSPARRCSLARRRRSPRAPSTPRTSSVAPTGSGGSRRATRPTWSCSTRPDWRYLAYHLGANHVSRVIQAGALAA